MLLIRYTRSMQLQIERQWRAICRQASLTVERYALPILICMSGAWAGLLIWLKIQRYLSFGNDIDLGVYVQVMWSTAHGRPFYMSLYGHPVNFLGQHFVPLLVVLAPFYRLWPDARLLFVVQTLALTLAVVPLFRLARRRLGGGPGLLIAAAYFLYPLLHSVALSGFREISLAVPLLMASAASLLDKRLRQSLVWLALAMLVKEEIAFIAIAYGLYIWLVLHRRRLGILVAAGASLWAVLLLLVLMPALKGAPSYEFFDRYYTLGSTPAEMLRTLLTRPLVVLRLVSTPHKLQFVGVLLAPLAALPLLGFPIVLLALPTLVYLLLSDYRSMTSITFYYAAPLIPFLLLAVVVALDRLRGLRVAWYRGALVALAAAALVAARLWSPLPGGQRYSPGNYRVTDADRSAAALLATIPPDASVASDNGYVPWVSNRFRLINLDRPAGAETWLGRATEYLAVRTLDQYSAVSPFYPWLVKTEAGKPVWVPRYGLVQQTAEGLTVWKWRGPEQDVLLPRYDADFEQGLRLVAAGTSPDGPAWGPVLKARAGTTVPIWMAWGSAVPLDQRITFSLHLLDGDGERVAQVDSEMARGHFPTTLWPQNETDLAVADEFALELPADLPAGRYDLMAGAFRTETVAPLSRPDGSQWVKLTQVEILP